jgi:E3 ubiquitin-protein ligase mind-bomb
VNLLSGDNLPQVSPPSVDMNKMKELENKIESLEDKQCCAICLDLTSNVAFSCGHLACSQCAQPLKQCHFCRQDIQQKIPLFFS